MFNQLVQNLCSKMKDYLHNALIIRLLKIEIPELMFSTDHLYWPSPILGMVTINVTSQTILICNKEDFTLNSRNSVPISNPGDLQILYAEIVKSTEYVLDKYSLKPLIPEVDYELDLLFRTVIEVLLNPVNLINLPVGSSWDQDLEILYWFDTVDRINYKIDPKNNTIEVSQSGQDYQGLDPAMYSKLCDQILDHYILVLIPTMMDNTPFSLS